MYNVLNWTTLFISVLVILYYLHRRAWHSLPRYHSWYVHWIGQPLIVGIWWKIRGVVECCVCCNLMKKGLTVCPTCNFDLQEYQRAKCRCGIQDQIADLDKYARAYWIAMHPQELHHASCLFDEPLEELIRDIVVRGCVHGLKTNQTTLDI